MPSDNDSQVRKRSGRHNEFYTDIGIAGRGKFATVKQCICKESKKLYAAKILNKNKMGKDNRENIEREIKLLQLSKECRLIVQIHEVFETPSVVTILTEYAPGKTVQDHLSLNIKCEVEEARHITRQLLLCLEFLHSKGIAHLDIKPANVLLMGPPPSHDIRLCDFGLAQLLEENTEKYQLAGTLDYMAPEVINFEALTTKSDVWSVGVLVYVLLSGMTPFNFENSDDQDVRLNITKCNYDFNECFEDIPEAAIEFIKSVLVLLHRDRPAAKECLKDFWFEANDNKENRKEKVENRRRTQSANIKIDVKNEDEVDIGEKITEILNEVKDRIQSPTPSEKNKSILSNQLNSPSSEEVSCSKKLVIEAKTPTRQSPLGCRRCLAISVDDEPAKRSKCFEYSPPIKS